MRLMKSVSGLFLILLATANLFAQNDSLKDAENLNAVLLKKDLAAAIKEAESTPANDVRALLRRLELYYRIVDTAKVAATVKQITQAPDFEKNRYAAAESVKYALKDEYFKDAETLRLFLQEINCHINNRKKQKKSPC